MDVAGRVAVVTGGGRGIGLGISLVLARHGADVVAADVMVGNAESTVLEVKALGREAMAIAMDVTDADSVASAIDAVIEHFGRIDILVNNAGVIGAAGWEERDWHNEDDWDVTYEVNSKGMATVIDATIPHMKGAGHGKIVNIASVAGRKPTTTSVPYAVSKAGVISLTQGYALRLAPLNINVNAICPGTLWTPMWERIATRNLTDEEKARGLTPKDIFDRTTVERTPLGREQTPEDVGNAVAFLASEAARNITGQSLNIDGGFVMS